MKKIALISYHTCPLSAQEGKETGGMNIYVYELAKNLAAKGCLVDVFTRDQDENKQKIVRLSDSLRVIHIQAGKRTNIPKKQLSSFIPEFVTNLAKFIEENELAYDAFDCHYYMSGIIGLALKSKLRRKAIPLIITFHTLGLMKNLVARSEEEKEPEDRIQAERTLVKEADRIISPGETDASYLQYLYGANPEKIAIVTPGVDTTQFKPIPKDKAKEKIGANPTDHILMFVGRIEPLKGIDVLMYAMKILLQKNPLCTSSLWIIGGDISQKKELWSDELQKLEHLRRELGITAEVKFIGRRHPEELPYYYNGADVVIMPSQYESFGISALEAMACGTPVITTNAAGVADVFDRKHENLITSANNPLLLASQIENLLLNAGVKEKIGKELTKNVSDLSWEKVSEKVLHLYDTLS